MPTGIFLFQRSGKPPADTVRQGARIEYSIDVYYRWLSGLKEFNGNIISLNESNDIASGIENGNGVTYGADFFARLITTPQLLHDKLLLFKKLQEI